jgi:hypothetical protein
MNNVSLHIWNMNKDMQMELQKLVTNSANSGKWAESGDE